MSSLFPLSLSIQPLTVNQGISPKEIFTPLAALPWAIWLDSGQTKHIDACFDIIVWQPKATLTTFADITNIHYIDSDEKYQSNEDPLSLLARTQEKLLTTSTITEQENKSMHVPFLGGALGYFSYDLGRRFESIPVNAEQDIGIPDMAVGIYSQAIVYDHKQKQYYLVCPANEREQIEASLHGILTKNTSSKATSQGFSLLTDWQSNMTKSSYVKKFNQVQQHLSAGDCYQINLAQRFCASYQGDEFEAYCALRDENKTPFSAFMRFEDSAILSVSPERFLQVSQGKVQSKPIKGTMPRSNNPIEDKENASKLQQSEKDRAENVMIVDLLRNDISKVCEPNSVLVPKLFDIESFPAVHHLVSTVEGQLAEHYNANDLLRAAFPGGSITGAPKIRAMEIIEQLEPHRRSVYCGSIGYISTCGTMDTSITIRTLVCQHYSDEAKENKVYCWAGGGLVADSTADSEYQETYDKVNRILPVLEKFTAKVSE